MAPQTPPRPAPGLRDPIAAPLRGWLRRAVLDHAATEHRRAFPALVHVGQPGAHEVVVATAAVADHSLRTDVVAAMLARHHRRPAPGPAPGADGTPAPIVWLTRPGDLDLQDLDVAWLGAAWAACAERGDPLTMVVVNRHGWRDPRSGVSRHWVRLRPR